MDAALPGIHAFAPNVWIIDGPAVRDFGVLFTTRMTVVKHEQQMYPVVQAQQKSARGFAKSFLPGSAIGLFVQQTMMKVLLRETFRGLLRRQLGA